MFLPNPSANPAVQSTINRVSITLSLVLPYVYVYSLLHLL